MSVLQQNRQEVMDQLKAAGLNAVDYIPARLTPPVVVISPGSPYVENGLNKTFNDVLVRLDFRIVTNVASNESMEDALEEDIETVLHALSNWDLEAVSQPFDYAVNNAVYLAADVTLTASLTI